MLHAFKGVFPSKEYDNRRNVAGCPTDFWHKELEMATYRSRDTLGSGGHMREAGYFSLLVDDIFSNGSLDSWIFSRSGGHSSYWGFRYKVAKYIAKAFEYLYGQRIWHLHIKPESVLLDGDFQAVESNFELSKLIRNDESRVLTAIRGTAGYMAPEWFLGITSEKCDVFSYGVLLLDMFFGERNVSG
ncbi:hypothetical protein GIB67_038452 [Kingdonia uniflora]|uniref:Protein kinase domain-containing protein n=1 Tax=Kingdonia uniflora TaxID=39325 RepID=A0A7J7NP41_9MAGN|nr:hypothetical protein GIB67_038452 [Kingdonia uniflora]